MKRTKLLVVAAVIALLLAMAGYVRVAPVALAVSTEASADAHVLKKTPNANTGTEQALAVRGAGTNETWAIFKFAGAPAGTATVTVHVNTARTGTFSLLATTCGWNEVNPGGITWANKPAVVGGALDTKAQAAGDMTFNAGTLPGGDACFYLQSSNSQSQASLVASREHATFAGPTLNAGPPPTTTTTTTTIPTTTTLPSTCVQMSAYPSPQAAVDATPPGSCVDANADYALTTQLNLNKDITLNCLVAGTGFHANSGAFDLIDISASGATVDGCDLVGSGPSGSITAVGFIGSVSGVLLDNLAVSNTRSGTIGDSGIQHDITIEDSTFTNIGGTAIAWYYGQESYNIVLQRNTITQAQRLGQTGQAGIQSGGAPEFRHHNWTVTNNTVNFTSAPSPGADQVLIGLDQLANSTISGNHLTMWRAGEGIALVGPNNQVFGNDLHAGARIIFMSYSGPGRLPDATTIKCNVGTTGTGTDQGISISFPEPGGTSPAMTNLVVTDNQMENYGYGVQAYAFNGNTVHGSGNTIQRNDLTPNAVGAYSIDAALGYTGPVEGTPIC